MKSTTNMKSNSDVKSTGSPKAPLKPKGKIWIDLDNTPHVPFFEPIIEVLENQGYTVLVTARDAYQVCQLADKKGVSYVRVGRHFGKIRLMKIIGFGIRTMQLIPLILRERPVIGLSHGARSQILVGSLLRVPSLCLDDYEHTASSKLINATQVMVPESLGAHLKDLDENTISYPGLKEDVYAWRLQPDNALLDELNLDPSKVIATVRPPATEAHYHNPEGERYLKHFMERANEDPNLQIVLLPRSKNQLKKLREDFPEWFDNGKVIVPEKAVDGMNLIWHSDFVVSGGGTMNREAAALGVPVYSIFQGKIGRVDQHLSDTGRLVLIKKLEDLDNIKFEKRPAGYLKETSQETLEFIVKAITVFANQISSEK